MAKEPRWVPRVVLDAAHLDQIREHGGLGGIRDENALEAALARARQKWHHDPKTTFPVLVAAYGFGIATVHPYRDGSKRAGFLAMAIFAGLNGHDLEATDAEVVTVMVGLAAGHVGEAQLAEWLGPRLVRSR
ncbi:MAG TPA: type II toxin-antitoxin system death-on-curing family toxin [Gemmatimonadales bacterium]|nr:type II toxin-antitoxin system death-on-curing family toxin [Gemmatimonadales bacterium]